MSDTPRTDAAHIGVEIVFREFAQELERELNAANERIKRLESAIDRASNRFFTDGSDGKVAAEMLTIMCGIADEEES
jgi:hypothetical protein